MPDNPFLHDHNIPHLLTGLGKLVEVVYRKEIETELAHDDYFDNKIFANF